MIADALTDFDGVLALGGGAILTESTRRALAACGVPVIWLRSSIRSLLAPGRRRPRPSAAGRRPRRRLVELAAAREPIYRAVATDDRGDRPAQQLEGGGRDRRRCSSRDRAGDAVIDRDDPGRWPRRLRRGHRQPGSSAEIAALPAGALAGARQVRGHPPADRPSDAGDDRRRRWATRACARR